MPRVLLVCEYASLNGGERSLLAMLDALEGAAYEFVAAAPQQGPLADEFRRRQIRVEAFDAETAGGGRLSQPARRERLAEIIRRTRPEVVHANSLSMSRLSGPVAAELSVPSLGHLRDIVRVSRRAIDDLNRHTRLLAVSTATRDFHVAAGLSPEKTHVLYNGVDLDRFRPRPPTGYLHRELRLPQGALLIGTIGQLGMRKGLDVLLAAAAKVAAHHSQAHFLLVGKRHSTKQESVEYERKLHAAANEPALAGRVHFLGERHDVPDLLNELALLVHAARQEPLGRVLLEAAACGRAIVATDAGGTREILPLESMARIVPVDGAAGLARAMRALLEDAELRQTLARAVRQRAEDAFEIHRAAANLARQYAQAGGGGTAQGDAGQ